MKIMTLCMSDGHGGLELYAQQCNDFFAHNSIESTVVAQQGTFFARHFENQCHFLPKSTAKPLPLINAKALAKLIDAEKPDILHIHWGKDLPLAALGKKFAQHKPKLIYSRHMKISHDKHDFYHRWLYQEVDQILTITNKMAKSAQQLLPLDKDKIQALYLGAPKPPAYHKTRAQFLEHLNLKPQLFTFCVIGRLEPAKGQHLAINAVKALLEQQLPVQLVIIGHAMSHEYLQDIKAQVEVKQLQDYVRFIDFFPNPMRIMPHFDCLALTTEQESFGLVLIEAMRCSVAVIGSNAGGVPEIIDDHETGLLFIPNDADDLAKKLKYYLQHPEQRQAIALAGKQKADAMFTQDKHFKNLVNVFER